MSKLIDNGDLRCDIPPRIPHILLGNRMRPDPSFVSAGHIPIMLNDREVEDISIGGVDTRDYPDFCDAFFDKALWADTGEQLTDEELVQLQREYPEVLNEMAFEHYILD